ncbi:hypothetical protein [Phenylobacterium sp.]|uniref:COG3904 family protein n=1 Tax=Phenylobacterium sp. TaxID=1871053 RepID=UPI0035B1517C
MAEDAGVHFLYRQTLGSGRYRIYADGDIDVDAAQRLREFAVRRRVEHAVVLLNSRGGSLVGGIMLGETIRKLGFDTSVAEGAADFVTERPGVCASACAYAYAGGVSRYLPTGSLIGMHQFYGPGDNIADRSETQAVSGLIVAFLARMGVDSEAFAIASSTPGDKMQWLAREQALRIGLVNDGALPTTAEIKLADGMTPYLRLEQQQDSGIARILLLCDQGHIRVTAGIVTSEETTQSKGQSALRSYFELDGKELLSMPAPTGLILNHSTLWVDRHLATADSAILMQAENFGIWTENGTNFRWGLVLNLVPVRQATTRFLQGCLGSRP